MIKYLAYSILFSACLYTTALQAQAKADITPQNADCLNAIELTDTVFGPTAPPNKYGTQLEVSGNDKKSMYYIEEEHHTVWYTFKCPCAGTLSLDIIPQSINDDYDFLLFRNQATNNYCDKIANRQIKPIRSNIARNDKTILSKTGLSKSATDDYVHSGPGSSYSRPIDIKVGQRYYLLVDNVYTAGKGHTIKLHYNCTPLVGDSTSLFDVSKLSVGTTVAMRNINFYPDTTTLLPQSMPELNKLLRLMQNNPGLKIEIGGHVDGIDKLQSGFYQKLSDARAKTIYTYLVENKIDAARLTWKGYSNTKKIHEKPKNQAEAKANRRVEIKILEK
ncbi:MAG: OmpA family protein [Sphingobacteriales bacterium JAD_PAG50586_3]|nr:MAG: OmpA family protein [Sphingobacteriales bacterium JAD_PAG50586_3]